MEGGNRVLNEAFRKEEWGNERSPKASKGSNDQILHKTLVPSLDAGKLKSNLL